MIARPATVTFRDGREIWTRIRSTSTTKHTLRHVRYRAAPTRARIATDDSHRPLNRYDKNAVTMADLEGLEVQAASLKKPEVASGPSFDGENKFQHAISVWRSIFTLCVWVQ